MYRLTIDHRSRRKSATAEDVFDLGAGDRNCIDCASRSGPKEEIGYCCATFVDAVTGAHLPAFDMRADESACGASALGFAPPETKTSAFVYDPLTGHMLTPLVNPLEFETPISDDPIVGATGESRSCRMCAHSFQSFFGEHTPNTYCGRAVNISSGVPVTVQAARGSEELCGAAGEWFETAPPMTEDEQFILAQGGSTFFHW